MSIIKLKNVSKFYYSKGVITSGFSKINLSFDMGEFVAITGESGSGKSTLLNVISGLDSYDEGEMYINGEETSHYTEKDFEDYRRKYVGNIFQNFNLVNSYTVYQNVELVLLLNGKSKKESKKEVLDLLKKVDLYKFRNTKVSKLSGGQKQRVAIARALAKDTPIIIADEPTGNLDSRSAKGVIKLLNEISKYKLVIVVTHNFEQVEEYVTRKIKMHDGRILEDKKIKDIESIEDKANQTYKNITTINKFKLGIRNAFNIIPKFVLIMLVYLFITVSIISEYATFKEQEYIESKSGNNYVFNNNSDKRIIIKNNNTPFNEKDYENITSLDNVDYIIKNDLLLDTKINITDNENYWINGSVNNIENFKDKVDIGRLPKSSNEIIAETNIDDYYLNDQAEDILNKTLYIQNLYTAEIKKSSPIKIVGIKYKKSIQDYGTIFYMSEELIDKFALELSQIYSDINILFKDKYIDNHIISNEKVPKGETYISNDLSYQCKNENCSDEHILIETLNIYTKENLDLKITKMYNKQNMQSLLDISDFDENNGNIYINPDDYNNLFNKENYQISVFVKDPLKLENTISALKNMNYQTLALKDTLVSSSIVQALKILKTTVTIILCIVLFFISYFVIKVILKSRNKYFSTIRMLGATKKISKQLLIIELLTVSNLAFFSFMLVIYLNSINIINIKFIHTILTYLKFSDYLLLYIILIMMSYLISQKFSKKLFKNSAMSTLREEI